MENKNTIWSKILKITITLLTAIDTALGCRLAAFYDQRNILASVYKKSRQHPCAVLPRFFALSR